MLLRELLKQFKEKPACVFKENVVELDLLQKPSTSCSRGQGLG